MASTTILSDNGVSSGSTGIKTTGGDDGNLLLQTTTAGGTATTAVTIDTSQNVGIGTSSPNTKLQVTNSTASDTEIRITNGQDANNVSIGKQGSSSFGQTSAGNGFLYTVSDWSIMSNGGAIKFATGGSTERMRINSSGNVGIGTSSPATRLHLNGSTNTTSSIYIQNQGTSVLSLGNEASWLGTGSSNNGVIASYGANSLLLGTNGAERARIDASGVVLVGATTQVKASSNPSVQIASAGGEQLVIRHTSATAGRLWRFASDSNNTVYIINQDTTGVYIGNGGTSWLSLSDERHKDIIEPITNASEKVATLRAVIGKYKKDEDGTRRSFLIAQDVQAVLPEAVFSEDPEQLGLSYTDTIPLLVAAIQEQKALINNLTERLTALEGAQA